mmetsp:Transcript_17032/g.59685  ORF Transcript_17032/g.59685 Transcript_17032/m.59685 type:complete len:1167 (-) Transcript_17032:1781-5281(-)
MVCGRPPLRRIPAARRSGLALARVFGHDAERGGPTSAQRLALARRGVLKQHRHLADATLNVGECDAMRREAQVKAPLQRRQRRRHVRVVLALLRLAKLGGEAGLRRRHASSCLCLKRRVCDATLNLRGHGRRLAPADGGGVGPQRRVGVRAAARHARRVDGVVERRAKVAHAARAHADEAEQVVRPSGVRFALVVLAPHRRDGRRLRERVLHRLRNALQQLERDAHALLQRVLVRLVLTRRAHLGFARDLVERVLERHAALHRARAPHTRVPAERRDGHGRRRRRRRRAVVGAGRRLHADALRAALATASHEERVGHVLGLAAHVRRARRASADQDNGAQQHAGRHRRRALVGRVLVGLLDGAERDVVLGGGGSAVALERARHDPDEHGEQDDRDDERHDKGCAGRRAGAACLHLRPLAVQPAAEERRQPRSDGHERGRRGAERKTERDDGGDQHAEAEGDDGEHVRVEHRAGRRDDHRPDERQHLHGLDDAADEEDEHDGHQKAFGVVERGDALERRDGVGRRVGHVERDARKRRRRDRVHDRDHDQQQRRHDVEHDAAVAVQPRDAPSAEDAEADVDDVHGAHRHRQQLERDRQREAVVGVSRDVRLDGDRVGRQRKVGVQQHGHKGGQVRVEDDKLESRGAKVGGRVISAPDRRLARVGAAQAIAVVPGRRDGPQRAPSRGHVAAVQEQRRRRGAAVKGQASIRHADVGAVNVGRECALRGFSRPQRGAHGARDPAAVRHRHQRRARHGPEHRVAARRRCRVAVAAGAAAPQPQQVVPHPAPPPALHAAVVGKPPERARVHSRRRCARHRRNVVSECSRLALRVVRRQRRHPREDDDGHREHGDPQQPVAARHHLAVADDLRRQLECVERVVGGGEAPLALQPRLAQHLRHALRRRQRAQRRLGIILPRRLGLVGEARRGVHALQGAPRDGPALRAAVGVLGGLSSRLGRDGHAGQHVRSLVLPALQQPAQAPDVVPALRDAPRAPQRTLVAGHLVQPLRLQPTRVDGALVRRHARAVPPQRVGAVVNEHLGGLVLVRVRRERQRRELDVDARLGDLPAVRVAAVGGVVCGHQRAAREHRERQACRVCLAAATAGGAGRAALRTARRGACAGFGRRLARPRVPRHALEAAPNHRGRRTRAAVRGAHAHAVWALLDVLRVHDEA